MKFENIVILVPHNHENSKLCKDCKKYSKSMFFIWHYNEKFWAKILSNPDISKNLYEIKREMIEDQYDKLYQTEKTFILHDEQPPLLLIDVPRIKAPLYVLDFMDRLKRQQSEQIFGYFDIFQLCLSPQK